VGDLLESLDHRDFNVGMYFSEIFILEERNTIKQCEKEEK
jgi:hypothetical protein